MPRVPGADSQTRSGIAPRERLIVALDVPTADMAKELVARIGEEVVFYKIGLELAMAPGYFALLDWLTAQGKRVFADLKLHDIPATVGAAVRNLSRTGATFVTVHADRGVVEAAVENRGPNLRILAVTVLTSINEADLRASGIMLELPELVALRARIAIDAGCDGVVASGHEAANLRAVLGAQALIVTPGIRAADAASHDDQKRVVTPRRAIEAGADYIVVGRPVHGAADPRAAARAIQTEIAALF